MGNTKVFDLEKMLNDSEDKLVLFDALESKSPNDPDCAAFVRAVESWLQDCVEAGRFLANGTADRRAAVALVEEWSSRFRRHGHSPKGLDGIAAFDPKAGRVLDRACPYPGLVAYSGDNKAAFFGRDGPAKEYAERLIARNIFLIVGASGSGKSSLALAGIQPLIKGLHADWVFPVAFTPGTAPLKALATVVAGATGKVDAAETLAETLRSQPETASAAIAAQVGDRPLLVVVDQFEELLTMCRDAGDQEAFARVLVALSDPDAKPRCCHTLLTLRTDHLARFDSSDTLKPLYKRLIEEGNFEFLPALEFADIRRAIVEPAKVAGLRFIPPDIPDRLASETAGLANGLPLLQFALGRLWDTRPKDESGQPLDMITDAMVKDLPTVQRGLGAAADQVFSAFSPIQKEICERAMLELVLLDENFEEPLRRRRGRKELNDVLVKRFDGKHHEIEVVEQRLINQKLLRTFGQGDAEQIEVTHEALLRHWRRINQLVSGEEVKSRLHAIKQVTREAMEWKVDKEDKDRLKQQGKPLKDALKNLEDGWFADAESAAYLRACEVREAAEGRRRKAVERMTAGIALVGLTAVALFVFWLLGKRDTNAALEATASLSDRLPALEALDMTYTLAKRGDKAFSLPLAHALERMESAWTLGDRDTSILPGGGQALLQLDRRQPQPQLHVHLIEDSTLKVEPINIQLASDEADRLAQVQIGPTVNGGTARWAILVFPIEPGKPSYRVQAHRLDPSGKPAAKKIGEVTVEDADQLSAIRFHPEGARAIFSAIYYQTLTSQLIELNLNKHQVRKTLVDDPVKVRRCDQNADPRCSAGRVISAVSYGAAGTLITGRLNGDVYCANREVIDSSSRSEKERGDGSPVRGLVSLGGPGLGSADDSGNMVAADCSEKPSTKPHRFMFNGDPASLSLTKVGSENGLVLSFFDTNQQLRCFRPTPNRPEPWGWYQCNQSHRLAASVLLSNETLLAVEQSGVGVVRRYPAEGKFGPQEKLIEARAATRATLRWAGGKREPLSVANPWQVVNGEISMVADMAARDRSGSRLVDATISADGKWLAWIEVLEAQAAKSDLDPKVEFWPDEPVHLIRTMDVETKRTDWPRSQSGQASVIAIDNNGRIAEVRKAKKSGRYGLYLNGVERVAFSAGARSVQCLSFSPTGDRLVAGTEDGEVYRVDTRNPQVADKLKPPLDQPVISATSAQRGEVPVTACAISDDGWVAAGYRDGEVRVFDPKGALAKLTERSVYRFPVPIRQVSITADHRVAALGQWQVNNCTSPGLPGQALRIWDSPKAGANVPLGNTCFPNEVVSGLGAWGLKPENDSAETCPRFDSEPPKSAKVGICLIGPKTSRWHECPGCPRPDESAQQTYERLLRAAAGTKPNEPGQDCTPETSGKCARELPKEKLLSLYGLKM